jgi:hypothetical protein
MAKTDITMLEEVSNGTFDRIEEGIRYHDHAFMTETTGCMVADATR